jgi:hypothetical protein
MLHIKSCKYADDYKIAVEFDNGENDIVDLQDLIEPDTVFAPLIDKELFSKVQLDKRGVVTWLNGELDIAAEYLYNVINQHRSEYQQLFKKWGYI